MQAAVEALDWWLVFNSAVSSFCAVFGAKIHIGRFLAVCNLPQWARLQTNKFKLRIVDWRWEVLELVLEAQLTTELMRRLSSSLRSSLALPLPAGANYLV